MKGFPAFALLALSSVASQPGPPGMPGARSPFRNVLEPVTCPRCGVPDQRRKYCENCKKRLTTPKRMEKP
jgi:hypothetical protein